MKKINIKSIIALLIVLSVTGTNTYVVQAMPYYDLKFKKISEATVKGEFEKLGEDIYVDEDTDMTMVINKEYKATVDTTLTKDEEDAISQAIGSKWNEEIKINKEEDISIKGNIKTCIMVRPVYKEIKGKLIKDYQSWEKEKDINIKIPVDVEYSFKRNTMKEQ